jgi:hypothetical protein
VNIPMVGFHDILCVLLSGHRLLLKLSSDDAVLLPFFLKLLCHYEPRFESNILFAAGKLGNFDAVIATGSNNTASHFQYYFSKYPHIIRKNRSSAAILKGTEERSQLYELGKDIFSYYGLGCRNVSKLFVPAGYDFNGFFESIVDFGYVIENKKYANNYEYHRALFLLEKEHLLDNNFLLLRQNTSLHSPVGVLHYEHYEDMDQVLRFLSVNDAQIQCVVGEGHIPFGYSQRPVITDFADKIDTCQFLVTL